MQWQTKAEAKAKDRWSKVDEVCRRLGVTQATFYRWKSKFGAMEVLDAKLLKQLEDENRRLKQMVADLSLDLQAAKMGIRKNGEDSRRKRRVSSDVPGWSPGRVGYAARTCPSARPNPSWFWP